MLQMAISLRLQANRVDTLGLNDRVGDKLKDKDVLDVKEGEKKSHCGKTATHCAIREVENKQSGLANVTTAHINNAGFPTEVDPTIRTREANDSALNDQWLQKLLMNLSVTAF